MRLVLLSTSNNAPARWEALPWPADANVTKPGFAWASWINCCSVLTGSAGFTTSTLAWMPMSVIGAKSSCGSNRVVFPRAEIGRENCGVAHQQRVAVGVRLATCSAGDVAAGARPVLDHDRLAQHRLQQARPARGRSRRSGRRHWRDDQRDGTGRKVERRGRRCAKRKQKQRRASEMRQTERAGFRSHSTFAPEVLTTAVHFGISALI